MKLFVEYVRTLLVSIEFLILVLTGIALYYHPLFVSRIRSVLNLEPDVLRWLALVPATCMVVTLKEVRKILFPEKDKKAIIQQWDQYWHLRVTTNVAVVYAVLFTLMALPAWIVKEPRFADDTLILMVAAIMGAGVDYLSVYNAEIKMNEVIAQSTQ